MEKITGSLACLIEKKLQIKFNDELVKIFEILKINTIDQKTINYYINNLESKFLDMDIDIDIFLYENCSTEKFLFKTYNYIEKLYESNKDSYNNIIDDLSIKIGRNNFYIDINNEVFNYTLPESFNIFKNEFTIYISREEIKQIMSSKFDDVKVKAKYTFISYLQTFKIGVNRKNFIDSLNHNLLKNYDNTFDVFDKNEINNISKILLQNYSEKPITKKELSNTFLLKPKNVSLKEIDFLKIYFESCMLILKKSNVIELDNFSRFSFFIMKTIKDILLMAQIKNEFYFDIRNNKFCFKIDDKEQNGLSVIKDHFEILFEKKYFFNHYQKLIFQNKEVSKISKLFFDTFEQTDEKNQVPEYFNIQYILGYQNLSKDLFSQNISFLIDSLKSFFSKFLDRSDYQFFENFKTSAIEAENTAKKIQLSYKNCLKTNFENAYQDFILYTTELMNDINDYEKNILKILSKDFANFVVRLSLLKEKMSIGFLEKIFELYQAITNNNFMAIESNNLKYEILTEFLLNSPSEFKYFQNDIPEFEEIYNDYKKKIDTKKFNMIINSNELKPEIVEILNNDEILNCQKTKIDQIKAKISDQEIRYQEQARTNDSEIFLKEKMIDPKVIELNQNYYKDKENEIDGQRKNFCAFNEHKKGIHWIYYGVFIGFGILIVVIIIFVIKKKFYNLK
ncbi:hypothetical protein GVAV_000969 [Gurleya vavrai]